MKREIKFRVWSRFHKYFLNDHGSVFLRDAGDVYNSKYMEESSTSTTVQLNTGLKDIENKEIYEGDIVLGYKNPHTVIFSDGAFYLTYKNSSVRLSRTCGALKIIGNIFENPELLLDSNQAER